MSGVQLSVTIITHNEAADIEACLRSVGFADEIVVVDSGSTDDTCAIAERCGARVIRSDGWPGFGPQKNFALSHATGEWVLSLDADERVTPELAREIQRVVAAPLQPSDPVGYRLSRLSRFCGQWIRHGDWYPEYILRLFRRDCGRFTDDQVHEVVKVEGKLGRLKGDLLHETMPTLEEAIAKMNRYTSGRALDQLKKGKRGGLGRAISHGGWAFFRSYVLKRGFLDGAAGFIVAVYVAENSYYRYLKLATLAADQGQPPSATSA